MGTGNTRSFVTDKGCALDLKLIATATALRLTKAQLGDGELPAGGSPYDRAGLVNYVMDASIEYVSPPAAQQVQVVIQAMPSAVTAPFIVKEAALFALDPDEGEILYAYISMADDPVELKPISNGVGRILSLEVNVLVSNVAEVTAEINPSANTKLLGMIQAHTSDHANPHGVTAEQVGALHFDVVITTQAEFEALIASPTWLDAVSVCFVGDGGALKFTRSDGNGCKIPQTVKQIQGVNSATIEITNFAYSSTNKAALWYETRPTDDAFWLDGLTVTCTGTGSGYGFHNCGQLKNCTGTGSGVSTGNVIGCGFSTCTRLINCTGTGNSTGGGYGNGYGFYNCNHLTNCIGVGSSVGYGYGFSKCAQLTNCTGKGAGTRNGTSYGHGFYNCTQLTNCTGTGIGTGDGSGYGFRSCIQIESCTGVGTADGTGSGYGFHNCTQLTNCTGTGNGVGTGNGNGYGYGFYSCTQLTNCTGTGSSTGGGYGDGIGFQNCNQLTNCIGTGMIDGTGKGYGFFSCNYLNGCKQGDTSSTTDFLGGTNTKVDTATVVAS